MTTIDLRREEAITILTLNRPERFNAFDLPTAQQMAEQLIALATDDAVRGVVISGAGRAFCAGGDLRWAATYSQGAPAAFHAMAARFHAAILEIRRMAKPVIAAINGIAAGGGFSLALACDFRVMERSATLRQAYTSSGLCIDGGGTFTLTRLVGLARALEIAALDPVISAEQAMEWGLATRIAEDGQSVAGAVALAEHIAAGSLHAFGWSKTLMTDALDTPLEKQLEDERYGLSACAAHPDGQEGLRAFVEKRKPVFSAASIPE